MFTFIKAFPINVDMKNVQKAMRKCPHVIPAKSNNGFGIDAHKRTVINAWFFNWLNTNFLTFPK